MSVEENTVFYLYDEKALDPNNHPVCHMELLKLKPSVDYQKVRQLLTAARAIPGVIELFFGKNNVSVYKINISSSKGYSFALSARFENAHYLRAFQKHPAAVAFFRYLVENAESEPIVVDFVDMPSRL